MKIDRKLSISSKELRHSDGTNLQVILDKLHPAEKKLINTQLEINYTRGFQQGIGFVHFAMENLEMNSISRNDIEQLATLAGEMRFCYSGGYKVSYPHFGDIFYFKAKNILDKKGI